MVEFLLWYFAVQLPKLNFYNIVNINVKTQERQDIDKGLEKELCY